VVSATTEGKRPGRASRTDRSAEQTGRPDRAGSRGRPARSVLSQKKMEKNIFTFASEKVSCTLYAIVPRRNRDDADEETTTETDFGPISDGGGFLFGSIDRNLLLVNGPNTVRSVARTCWARRRRNKTPNCFVFVRYRLRALRIGRDDGLRRLLRRAPHGGWGKKKEKKGGTVKRFCVPRGPS